MKVYYSLTILFFLVVYSFTLYSQNESINYKFSRITLTSGEVIKSKIITLYDDKVSFSKYNSTKGVNEYLRYSINDIQKIEVATKNNAIPGLLVGTGVGIVTMLLVESNIEKPKSGIRTTSTYTETYTEWETMSPVPKLLIVAGGSLLGTIIGVSIKKGWKAIFPKSSALSDKFDFNLTLNPNNVCTSEIAVSYRFETK